jgi:DNA-binding transcriptional regulator GbsR (MarR family)
MAMAPERLSRLQRRILAWLVAEDQRWGIMAASHQDLVRALAHHKGNLSSSLRNLAAKGLVTLTKTPGGKIEAVDLTRAGWAWAEVLNKAENRTHNVSIGFDPETETALQERAAREGRSVEQVIVTIVRQYLTRLTQSEGRGR